MYLCGFTLFLTLILTRTYSLVSELVLTKDKLDSMKANGELSEGSDSSEVAQLKKQLASKDQDLETLKEQAQGLSNDYESVSGEAKY